jgi:L-asparaginase II
MTAEPGMVAGPGRFTTRLMEATGGRVLGKEGAEGLYGLTVRGPVALGIAVKIADGGERCRDSVVLDVLRQMGSLAAAEHAELASFYSPEIFNWRGFAVGRVEPLVELEELEVDEIAKEAR